MYHRDYSFLTSASGFMFFVLFTIAVYFTNMGYESYLLKKVSPDARSGYSNLQKSCSDVSTDLVVFSYVCDKDVNSLGIPQNEKETLKDIKMGTVISPFILVALMFVFYLLRGIFKGKTVVIRRADYYE